MLRKICHKRAHIYCTTTSFSCLKFFTTFWVLLVAIKLNLLSSPLKQTSRRLSTQSKTICFARSFQQSYQVRIFCAKCYRFQISRETEMYLSHFTFSVQQETFTSRMHAIALMFPCGNRRLFSDNEVCWCFDATISCKAFQSTMFPFTKLIV